MNNQNRLYQLLKQYSENGISQDDLRELRLLINSPFQQKAAEEWFLHQMKEAHAPEGYSEERLQAVLSAIHTQQEPVKQPGRHYFIRRYWWAAASVVLMVGAAYLLFSNTKSTQQNKLSSYLVASDVNAPDANRAMITLANGKTIYLDSAGNGTLAQQNNITIIKTGDGKIVYSGLPAEGKESLNTLTNPRGSKVIDMVLSDGSRVWLNAGSSVTYPVAFTRNERKVSITGEAYFEITHNAAKPFIVNKGHMNIRVLGTHFNVNAYEDEKQIKVTLLEGSVNVSQSTLNGNWSTVIKPGQQAVVMNDVKIRIENNVDIERVMAWKNGFFSFDNADLPSVMRELSRWYGIEVAYAGKIPGGKFQGEIPRDLTLTQLLNGLTSTHIHFEIGRNKKITILPE